MASLAFTEVTGHNNHIDSCAENFFRKAIRSQQTVHPEHACKDAYFLAKEVQFEKAGIFKKLGSAFSQKPFLEAPYTFAYRISKQKKPHNIGETMLKPGILEMIQLICALKQRKNLEAVPLSNDVIYSRIIGISFHI
jgi:hypothetical protein